MLKIDELLENLKPDASTLKSLNPWAPAAVLARGRRLVHGLMQLAKLLKNPQRASIHCDWDAYDAHGRLLVIGCTCGRVFWYRGRKGTTDETDGDGDPEPDQPWVDPY